MSLDQKIRQYCIKKCVDWCNHPRISNMNPCSNIQQINTKIHTRENIADTLGKVTYSLAVGTALDYFKSGLRGLEILTSRAIATGINTATGTPYAKWRRAWYDFTHTTNESNKLRKALVELGAFNTFETYVYGVSAAAGAAFGYLVTGEEFNPLKICEGIEGMVYLSPLIGPTMGMWLNATCKIFGVKPVAERKSS